MPLFGKRPAPSQPEFKDDALAEVAEMFFNYGPEPTPGVELLDTLRLDFTVESLRHVDDYLEAIAARARTDRETQVIVLRCGAYVGEAIRRNSARSPIYHWLDYDEAIRLDNRVGSFGGKSLALMAVLWSGTGFTFPLNKVGKFLENGREDSTYFYAAATIANDSRHSTGSR